MVAVLPVHNKIFLRDAEAPNEVPGADKETKSHFSDIFFLNLARLVRNYPVIIVRQHHTDQKQMRLLKGQFAE